MFTYAATKSPLGAGALFKGIQSRNIHTGNQEMNIVRAFIRNHAFQIHHVSHNTIIAGDAHAAQYLPGIAGNVHGNLAAVALCHAYLLRRCFMLVH